MNKQSRSFVWTCWSRLALALVLAAVLTACSRPAIGSDPQRAPAPVPEHVERVYFVPAQPHRQPYLLSDWRSEGFTLVHRAQDLYDAVGPETEVIAFDAEVIGAMDVDWLRTQYAQHRVIVAVNLNLHDLEQLLADTPPWTWTQPWRPVTPDALFAVRVRGLTCSGASQERFVVFAPLETFMRAIVLPKVACAKQ